MCGIYGWNFGPACPLTVGQREAFAASLSVLNARRGPHSWGLYGVTRGGPGEGPQVEIIKRVGNLAMERGIGAFGLFDTVMGHTRWATTGAVTEANCHPFTVGDVTVGHNGMIYNHDRLAAQYGRTCAVDSQHIGHHLHERIDFRDMEGYGAIEYVRKEAPQDVHLARISAEGQLAVYGLGEKGKPWGVAWSSDAGHLKDALHAARIKAFAYEPLKLGRVYIAGADGVLYLLPPSISHTLSGGKLTAAERERNLAVTSGHAKDHTPPAKDDLTGKLEASIAATKGLTESERIEREKTARRSHAQRKSAKGRKRAERKAKGPRAAGAVGPSASATTKVGLFDSEAEVQRQMDADAEAWLAKEERREARARNRMSINALLN